MHSFFAPLSEKVTTMKRTYFIFIVLSSLFLSCELIVEKDIDGDGEKKLVIEGYLCTGDSVMVNVSSSAKLTEEIPNFYPDLDVFIVYDDIRHKLRYAGNGSSQYYLSSTQFTVPNSGELYLETYFQGKSVTSKATVPEKITIQSYDVFLEPTKYFDKLYWKYRSGFSVRSLQVSADFKGNSCVWVVLQSRIQYVRNDTVAYGWETVFSEYVKIKQPCSLITINNTLKPETRRFVDTTLQSYKLFLYAIEDSRYDLYRATQSQQHDADLLGSLFGNTVTEIPTNINNGYGIFTAMARDTLRKGTP